MAYYFTKETDKSIVKFLATTNTEQKHETFNDEIRPAFEKLIENLIFVYGFFNIDDVETLKKECLTNLYEMIPKYNPEKGSKAFSYFNVIAKNWFIQKTREKNKRNKLESELYYDLDHESVKNDPNFMLNPFEALVEEKEKWVVFYKTLESWRGKLTKKTEKQVLEAVIFLMNHPELVTIYNKKAVYLYLRELTGLNTKQVVVNLKKIKCLYDEWHEEFYSTGEVKF
ncbi:MAG: hypothetical protein WC895_04310 [Candidatus Shapirobacteria bacterium]|jgi:DNA-directed RNA polymerase specialized sigma24 family protein